MDAWPGWLAYALIDNTVLLAADMTTRIAVLFTVSFVTKLVAVYWGPDAVLNNLFMRLGAEWDAFTVHPRSLHGAGDSVIVEGRYTGTYKPTGKSMDTQVCHVWDVKDGKVTRFQQYVDTSKLQEVMRAT